MLLAFTCSSGAQNCPKAGTKDTDWSKLAVQLCRDSVTNQLHLEVPSPDGKKLLYVNDQDSTLYLKYDNRSAPQEFYAAFGTPEVLWSPDSKAVAITTCSGGNGPCSVDTFLVSDKGALLEDKRLSPFEIVQKAFVVGHKEDMCYTEAKVGALTWIDGSDKIVMITQVPTAHCEGHNGGHLEAFVVSLSERKLVSRFKMQETIRRWHGIFGNSLRVDIPGVQEETKLRKK
jgi:hypothetical protein